MTDIAPVAPPSPRMPAPTSDAGASSRADDAAPISGAPAGSTPPPAPTREALQRQIDRVLEEANTSLRFRVDDASGRIVVSVIDGRGEVVMQVPDQTALAIARQLARGGSLLDMKA